MLLKEEFFYKEAFSVQYDGSGRIVVEKLGGGTFIARIEVPDGTGRFYNYVGYGKTPREAEDDLIEKIG